jgi:hypothetical protein
LKAEEEELLSELRKIQEVIQTETTKLECVSTLIRQVEEEYSIFTREAPSKSVPGSDAEDQQVINNVDGIHL